jgi:hypothetical protein
MTDQRWEQLVRRLEALAARKPGDTGFAWGFSQGSDSAISR